MSRCVPYSPKTYLKRFREGEEKTQTLPAKRSRTSQGRAFSHYDLQILDCYKKLSSNNEDFPNPETLLQLIKRIYKTCDKVLIASLQADYAPKFLKENQEKIESLEGAKIKTSIIKCILVEYRLVIRRVNSWMEPYACMQVIQKVIKKNLKPRIIPRGVCLFPDNGQQAKVVAGLLPDKSGVYIAKLEEVIGAGAFGIVYEAETNFPGKKAIKLSKAHGYKHVFNECTNIYAVHSAKCVEGVQFPPISYSEVKTKDGKCLALLEEKYEGNLEKILEEKNNLFTCAEEVFKAFKPLFEALAYCFEEKRRVHLDIKLNNILVLTSSEGVRLDLADWGNSTEIPKHAWESYNYQEGMSYLIRFVNKWKEIIPDSPLETFVSEGSPDQLLECTLYVLHSIDIYRLGMALKKALEITIYSDPTSSEWMYLRGWRFPSNEIPLIDKIDTLLRGVTNNYYEKNSIAGINLTFPERFTAKEALKALNEILAII